MADEQNLDENSRKASAEVPQEGSLEAAADLKHPGIKAFVLSLVFVLASVMGIFSYALKMPISWLLGGGLLGWSLMDLFSQRAHLAVWKDRHSRAANALGLVRALFFAALGSRLLAQSFKHTHPLQPLGANTLLLLGAGFVCAYLILAYAVELTARTKGTLPHALLLAALALQFLSFFCFAVPFTITWAACLSLLAFGFTGFAMLRGVTKATGSQASSVALTVALLGAPLASFLVQQIFLVDQQPVFQGSILLPRFFEIKKDLSKDSISVAWAPVDAKMGSTQGARAFSDKIALINGMDEQKTLTICVRNDNGDWIAESPMDADTDPAWWSPDAKLLVATGGDSKDTFGTLSVYRGSQKKDAQGSMQMPISRLRLRGEDAMPAESHGQVWSKDSKTFFYAGPKSLRMLGGTGIFSARVSAGSSVIQKKSLSNQSWPSKVYPAVAPDSSKVVYVGELENKKFINIGETEEGLNPRVFLFAKEAGLFPAWNMEQTHVLFVDQAGVLKIMSANNKSDAVVFTRDILRSHVWKNEQGKIFTLTKAETGDVRQVWTMNLNGSDKKMIYESRCNEIYPPVWSPDSTRIALIERSKKKYSVLTLAKDGTWPRKFFVTEDKARSLVWSPDSALLAWITERENGDEGDPGRHQELWTVAKDSLTPTQIYETIADISGLTWSPRSQHLAFEERWSFGWLGLRLVRPDLYSVKIIDLKDNHARSVTVGGLFARQPAFSPQGTVLSFITEQNRWSLKPYFKRPAVLVFARLF